MRTHTAARLTVLLAIVSLLVGACGSASSENVGSTAQGVASGDIYNFGAIAHSGSCLDARSGGTADGTQLQEWSCNGTGAQSFELVDDGAGGFYVVNTQAQRCVDVQSSGTANGTKIQLWDCNHTTAQTFTVRDAGGGFVSFVNTNSGKCLDVQADNPADGTIVQLYDCNGTNAQRWNPTVIGAASGSSSGGSSSTPTPTPPPPSSNGSRTFTFQNHCGYDVWVGGEGNPVAPPVACSAGCPADSVCNTANQLCTYVVPSASNWEVAPGQSMALDLPPAWGGRFWPRTECTTANGHTTCATGDCAGNLECPVGVGGAPPATLAEFTVTTPSHGSDFYDVSDVDGSNVPLSIAPTPGTFDPTPPPGANVPYYCQTPGCTSNCGSLPACPWNLPSTCPAELQDNDPGHYVGCRSANQVCAVDPSNPTLDCANEDDLYGCTGGGPNGVSGSCYSEGASATCCGCPSWSPPGACQSTNPRWTPPSRPGTYAQVLKNACPTAYSFPYDDLTSTFTCQGSSSANTSYTITFCP
jgi:hypothetical protein